MKTVRYEKNLEHGQMNYCYYLWCMKTCAPQWKIFMLSNANKIKQNNNIN